MGASPYRISVLPIGTWETEELLRSFNNFAVSRTECTFTHDRDRLLGIIEMGFGSFSAFDRTIVCLLTSRLCVEGEGCV